MTLSVTKTQSKDVHDRTIETIAKGGRSRIVPIPAALQNLVMQLVDSHGLDEYLIRAHRGGRWTTPNWRNRVWFPALRAAGMDEIVRVDDPLAASYVREPGDQGRGGCEDLAGGHGARVRGGNTGRVCGPVAQSYWRGRRCHRLGNSTLGKRIERFQEHAASANGHRSRWGYTWSLKHASPNASRVDAMSVMGGVPP